MAKAAKPEKITQSLEELNKEYEEKRKERLEPARQRLEEIKEERRQLDAEEDRLRDLLNLGKKSGTKRRRQGGKRVTAAQKKDIVGRFVKDGHIKDKSELTKELRRALLDEGLNIHDFRKLNEYLPSGWKAKSNNMRGTAAKTVFQKS